jgi:hypothetical protein
MYFKQHRGLLLLEEMKSKQGLSFTLFTKKELEEATGNFDERRREATAPCTREF